MLTLFLGSFFFATIVGNITVMIQDWDLGASKFREKLRSVVENMQQMALPLELQVIFLSLHLSNYLRVYL